MAWFPVKCAECVKNRGFVEPRPVFRVEPTEPDGYLPVEVRHRSRRPGGQRVRWVPIFDLPTPSVAYCDGGHTFTIGESLDVFGFVEGLKSAVIEAASAGAVCAIVRPGGGGTAKQLRAQMEIQAAEERATKMALIELLGPGA